MAQLVTVSRDVQVVANFVARRGDTFYMRMDFLKNGTKEDLTGSTFKMQLRNGISVILELNETNGKLVKTAGRIEMKIPAADMENLATGTFDYDLQQTWTVDSSVLTRVKGTFSIVVDITRAA